MKSTIVTVTVEYAREYDGEVTEDDIDINDIIKDRDAITDLRVKTWTPAFYDKYLRVAKRKLRIKN